tara:strand:- start:2115 stop:2342 length:228 start_codon:yes stop_codon:yes gene_type:complete
MWPLKTVLLEEIAMFQALKTKFKNVTTLKFLCERAEIHALQDQQREPGAEHFLLAALDLPDGTRAPGLRAGWRKS